MTAALDVVKAVKPNIGSKRKGINGFTVGLAFAGSLLLYSGVKGYSISKSLQDILRGKAPSSDPQNVTPPGVGDTSGDASSSGSSTGPVKLNSKTAAASRNLHGNGQYGGTPPYNKKLGQLLAAMYGWSAGSNWSALDKLWTRESGWDQYAKNSSSGAYGIAQALPQTKYPKSGQSSGGSSPYTQIAWGLSYIKQRYGSPSKAWAHETANSWY